MQVTFHGITRSHKDWAEFLGVSESTMRWRIAHWGVERALTEPKEKGGRKRKAPCRPKLSDTDQQLIATAYVKGRSEDEIGGLMGISRAQVSRCLIQNGLKIKGKAPKRVVTVATDAEGGVTVRIETE